MRKEEALVRVIKDKKRFFIKKPQPLFKLIPAYQKAYEEEARLAQSWRHSNLLTCLGIIDLNTDKVICYEYESAIPLSKALLEDFESISNEAHCIVNQLLDVVSYIHSKGGIHADIHPGNIYITKNGSNLKLINSVQPYLSLNPSFHLLRADYAAPELLAEKAESNSLCDIYSIGKTIEYIYSYSRVTTGIDKVIKKATQTDPSKRYATVDEMKVAFGQKKYWDWGVMALKSAVCFGIITLFYLLVGNEKPTEEDITFFEESQIHQKTLEKEREQTQYQETYTDYHNIAGGNISERAEIFKQEEEARVINENLFKKEFRKEALPIVRSIYTPQLMNGTQQAFQERSLDAFEQLDNIQKKLADELGISLISANSLASNIISELTEESMKKLTEKDTE